MSSEMTRISVQPQVDGEESPNSTESESTPTSPSCDRKTGNKGDPKVCGVCGAKALGNNFNAITCESCKAFFRRNALRTKEFVCPFSNNCKVDAITRRFCQRCRLKKCFEIGMKKEWIMTEEEKKIKKQKIEQNRLKRSSFENSGEGFLEDDTSPSPPKLRKGGGDGGTECSQSLAAGEIAQSPKQPMMEHNHNQNTSSIPSWSAMSGFRERNEAVLGITVETPNHDVSFVEATAPAQLLGTGKHELRPPTTIPATLCSPPSPPCSQNSTSCCSLLTGGDADGHCDVHAQTHPLLQDPTKQLKLKQPTEGLPLKVASVTGDSTSEMPLLSSLIRHVHSPCEPAALSPPISIPSTIDSHLDSSKQGEWAPAIAEEISCCASPSQSSTTPLTGHQPNCTASQLVERGESRPSSLDDREESNRDKMALYEDYMKKCQRCNGCQDDEPQLIPLPLNTIDSILSVAIAAEFNAFGLLGTNTNSKELNKAEQAKLNELLLASQALHTPVDAERPISASETSDPSLINVINLTEIAIRRLIKMSKKISGFKNMCQEDQVALLKGGCTEMMVIRSVTTYDPDRDSWQIPHSNQGYNINLGVLKEARGNLYEEHQRFVKSFRSEWRTNESIMIILCAITLFTPERLNVVHKDVVKLEQDSYYYLLKRYLESIMNGCEAKSTYLRLIRKIAELRKLNSSHVRVFLEMNPKEVEPLLIEIFDLK